MTTANHSVYTGSMRWFKVILRIFLVLIFTAFILGKISVFGVYDLESYNPGTGGLVPGQVCDNGCPPPPGAGLNNGGNNYSGFYLAPNGNYYPIGVPVVPGVNNNGTGGGPAETGGVCTGVYANCTNWSECSTSCGPGTQIQNCFDTGCSAVQTNTQACQVNDPNVWGDPVTACTVNCGGGTWDKVNQCGTTQAFACNTSACPAWTKLKDSSFISTNSLFNMISLTPQAYDADDTTEQYFVVGQAGLVAAPGIILDISTVSLTAKTGNPEYKVIYTPESYSLTPSTFLSYVRARKEYKVITDLGEITGSGIYVYNGDISISSNVNPFDQPYKVVLVVSGTVTVSSAPDNTFTPTGTAAVVATTINFDSTITEAQGIFVGRTVSTGTNANQGLKIVGNLIAQTTLSNNREWPTTTRPSVFIKFDQAKYISLLPYLSTASYQWRQIQ